MVFNIPHGIPSFAFRTTMSSGLMVTFPISNMSLTSFFSSLEKYFISKPVYFDAVVAVAISIFLRIILFLLITVRLQHSSEGLYALGVDVKTFGYSEK